MASLHCMSSTSSCFAIPHKPKSFAIKCGNNQNSVRCTFLRCQQKSLAFSTNLSISTSPIAGFWIREVEKREPQRTSVVCDAATKKADSAAKRAKQSKKRAKQSKKRGKRAKKRAKRAKKRAKRSKKRAKRSEKRRVYNKEKKSEMKTQMKKALEALDALKKKTEAQADEIIPVKKLISEAYSAIDKAVQCGALHKNTGANRKSRLARRKKTVEIHHGWYAPAATA